MNTEQNTALSTVLAYSNKMSIEQLNERLVKESEVICKNVRKARNKYKNRNGTPLTSDIIPPLCYINMSLHRNIDNVLACFSNTLGSALFYESECIRIFYEFEALATVIMIF